MFSRLAKATLSIGLATCVVTGGERTAPAGAAEPTMSTGTMRAAPTRQLSVTASKSMIMDFDEDIRDVLVSNPTVADAVVRTNRRLYLMGNKLGTTNIFVFGAGGRQIASYELQVQPDIQTLQGLIKRILPDYDIKVEAVAGAVVLVGEVASSSDSMHAYEVAAKFVGAPASQGGGAGGDAAAAAAAPAAGGGSGGKTTGETVQVINALTIRGKDQVMLKVTIAEMQRTAIKKLGVDLTNVGRVGVDKTGIAGAVLTPGSQFTNIMSQNTFAVTPGVDPALKWDGTYKLGSAEINSRIQALEQLGILRTLAEPNLTAVSGEAARFLVGGEYPVPVAQSNSGGQLTTSIEFKSYGVALNFIPVVLSEGRISLTVNTEVSELTSEGAVTVGQLTIPALHVRRASTTLEIPSGGAMVLGGLIRDDVRQAMAGTPGLMKLPILGTLFRSRDFQRAESELTIFVTPYIVRPTSASKLQRPDQNFQPASDAAANFLGRVNRMYRVNGSQSAGSYRGQYGYIYE